MSRAKMVVFALLFAFALWITTHAEAMPAQTKIIIEDNSGPWLLAAALITAAVGIGGSAGLIRRRREQPVRRKK